MVGAAGMLNKPHQVTDIGVSLGTFLLSLLFFGQLGNRLGRRNRPWLLATNLTQASLILITAICKTTHAISNSNPTRLAEIVLLTISAAMQITMAKGLSVPEVPTAMLTSPFADLLCDKQLWERKRVYSRDLRFIYIVSLISGGCVGAFITARSHPASPVFLAFAIKLLVGLSFFFNPSQQSSESSKS